MKTSPCRYASGTAFHTAQIAAQIAAEVQEMPPGCNRRDDPPATAGGR
ncbi:MULTISPECIES: hypothetical protein [unclassified Streptomyces]|nr:hypothetical protein [Streptomyces sp. CNQ-509]